MRIDARVAGFVGYWNVWDVPACRPITTMLWCDDDFAQWGEYVHPYLFAVDGTTLVTQTHEVNRIVILPDRKLVLVNPLDDFDEMDRIALESLMQITLRDNGVFVSTSRSPWVSAT